MKFKNENASVYFPSEESLLGVTDMCIAAHQDDIEIMAYAPISECYESDKRHFCGVVVTDGAGSPRTGEYANYTDLQMKEVRISEQRKAAELGKYRAVIQLGYPSSAVKDSKNCAPADEIYDLLMQVRPKYLYTHNIADKHDTHVAVALRVISAVKKMPKECRPEKIIALEVWRGLDWLSDSDKICLDTSAYPELATELLQVHRSQVVGGKRYDNAAVGRRYANATFFASHNTDSSDSLSFGMDLLPMIEDDISPKEYIARFLNKFISEVNDTLERLS